MSGEPMCGHVLSFRAEDLEPGWADCVRCGKRMKLAEYVSTSCVPREKEPAHGPH